MNKIVLCLIAGCIALMGCLPSTYKEGMTVIGIPEPATANHQSFLSVASDHDLTERNQFNDWSTECQAKLGNDIVAHTRFGVRFPTFDLQGGWSFQTPRMSVDIDEGSPIAVQRFHAALTSRTRLHAVGATAVIGRFGVQDANATTLDELSKFIDHWNDGQEAEDRLWFRKSSSAWTSGLMALTLKNEDGRLKPGYCTFANWLRDVSEKEAVPVGLLDEFDLEGLLSSDAVLGPNLIGASGVVSFHPLALALERDRRPIGCLPITPF